MEYASIERQLSKNDLIKLCIELDKTPEDIMKAFYKNAAEAETWSTAHIEYGDIVSVNKLTFENNNSYQISVTWNSKKADRNGNHEKTTRTGFYNDNDRTFMKYKNIPAGTFCKFYVGYNPNINDGSVYRVLLSIEEG